MKTTEENRDPGTRLNHPAILALGITTLCLLTLISPFLNHTLIYHLTGSAMPLFLTVAANFLALWLFLTLLLWVTRKPGPIHLVLRLGLGLILPWILLKDYVVLTTTYLPHAASVILLLASFATFLLVLLLWRDAFLPTLRHLQSFVASLLGATALLGLLLLGQLGWFAWQARHLNQPIPLHPRTIAAAPRPRIIWILLDELSYQQVYGDRFPNLQLPAFDQLATQSTVFTHVQPAGIFTEVVIPSLLSGHPADDIQIAANGRDLNLLDPATDTWQPFNPHDTIFQDALDHGYSTAVAGWFNPYCRILPTVLDQCTWTGHLPILNGLFDYQPLRATLFQPATRLLATARAFLFRGKRPTIDANRDARLHTQDYNELFAASDRLLADPSATFVFLHMPIPHPNPIYNRHTHTFNPTNSSYLDNLALADEYLAHVHQLLQQQNQWDSSTILVMGDHAWRTRLIWSTQSTWTPEDAAASHQTQPPSPSTSQPQTQTQTQTQTQPAFDNRPGYILKLPNQQTPNRIDQPFAAIETRNLLKAILNQTLKTPEDLNNWLQNAH